MREGFEGQTRMATPLWAVWEGSSSLEAGGAGENLGADGGGGLGLGETVEHSGHGGGVEAGGAEKLDAGGVRGGFRVGWKSGRRSSAQCVAGGLGMGVTGVWTQTPV